MQQQWRYVDTGSNDAACNMALDEAMLRLHEAGTVPSTLRVYSWNTPTLSLGYAQKTTREINLAACQKFDVAVVRRPTGGRAVLHDQEVTYSVVMPISLGAGSATLTENYRRIALALQAALQRLGLPVVLERPRRRFQPHEAAASPACFAALSRYELGIAGKKVVGSAQKRLQRSLLQHGSIPLWLDRQRLFQCLQVPPERQAEMVQDAYTLMVAVNEMAAVPVSPSTLHEALRDAFSVTFDVELCPEPIRPEEWQLAEELRRTKYATPAWNLDGAAAWRAVRDS